MCSSGTHSLIHTVSHAWCSLIQSHFVLNLRSIKKNQPERAECNYQHPSILLRWKKTPHQTKPKKPKPKANNWVYFLVKRVLQEPNYVVSGKCIVNIYVPNECVSNVFTTLKYPKKQWGYIQRQRKLLFKFSLKNKRSKSCMWSSSCRNPHCTGS